MSRQLEYQAKQMPRIDLNAPFGRLALTHILSLGGDALVALVLAGSLFFSIDPSGARWRIALYLVFTMAPFALVGPLIGPAMDRVKGGRQLMLVVTTGLRAVVGFMMVASAGSNSLLLFPEAFAMLVLSKSYSVAKASVVPTTVTSDRELVEANSKLQVLGGIAAVVAGVPGGLVLLVAGPSAVAGLCGLVFIAGTAASLRIPRTETVSDPDDPVERSEFRSVAVLSAASGMGTLRWVIGFVTFLLAFALRGNDTKPGAGMMLGHMLHRPGELDMSSIIAPGAPPVWHFGVVVAFSAVGGLIGAALAPHVRRMVQEEYLLVGSLIVASVSGLVATILGGLIGMSLLALGVAISAAAGKQAFDAVVQRDAPEADRGRIFGRFESRFQIVWVLGAGLPVVLTVPVGFGAAIVFAASAAGAVFYAAALLAISKGQEPPKLPGKDRITTGFRVAATQVRSRRTNRPGPTSPDPSSPDPTTTSPTATDPTWTRLTSTTEESGRVDDPGGAAEGVPER